MRKFILFFVLINVLPVVIAGWYLYENIGGAESVDEVIENAPFGEFIYLDHNMIIANKDNMNNLHGIYKDLLIFINGIYISSDGKSFGIKMPLASTLKYVRIDNYTYYNGCVIKGNVQLEKPTSNDLITLIPQSFKDIVVYRKDSVIGGLIENNEIKYVWVFRKKKNINAKIIRTYLDNVKKHNPNLIDYSVIDYGDKVYVYLEYRGLSIELPNMNVIK
ncbi:hypothetical protein [Methanotorris igneus]|uniref:VAR1 protein isolog n=1 Tax=Methanotorris igneus (strain DSM 5666 / JCM 11834 / Kol 5) TaxID=880724 RepID=F6BF06_METIK|nr:hypothetical protein [Methanotorris igneus]AEF95742.1 VAR1 protein isolog [Methanotorris igneus Kol 5]